MSKVPPKYLIIYDTINGGAPPRTSCMNKAGKLPEDFMSLCTFTTSNSTLRELQKIHKYTINTISDAQKSHNNKRAMALRSLTCL
jgi:hypothetical protein